jgi:hypothetical protein
VDLSGQSAQSLYDIGCHISSLRKVRVATRPTHSFVETVAFTPFVAREFESAPLEEGETIAGVIMRTWRTMVKEIKCIPLADNEIVVARLFGTRRATDPKAEFASAKADEARVASLPISASAAKVPDKFRDLIKYGRILPLEPHYYTWLSPKAGQAERDEEAAKHAESERRRRSDWMRLPPNVRAVEPFQEKPLTYPAIMSLGQNYPPFAPQAYQKLLTNKHTKNSFPIIDGLDITSFLKLEPGQQRPAPCDYISNLEVAVQRQEVSPDNWLCGLLIERFRVHTPAEVIARIKAKPYMDIDATAARALAISALNDRLHASAASGNASGQSAYDLLPEAPTAGAPPTVGCAVCGKTNVQRCSTCKNEWYCCREHQGEHWRTAHRTVCKLWQAVGRRIVRQRKISIEDVASVARRVADQVKAGTYVAPPQPPLRPDDPPLTPIALELGVDPVYFASLVAMDTKVDAEIRQDMPSLAAHATGAGGDASEVAGAGDDDDDDIQVSDEPVAVPLTCPNTLSRISIPVRGSQCKHLTCMDLTSFLTFATSVSNCHWCSRPVYVDELAVSKRVLTALQSYPGDVTSVRAFREGPYMAVDGDGRPVAPATPTAGELGSESVVTNMALLARSPAALSAAAVAAATLAAQARLRAVAGDGAAADAAAAAGAGAGSGALTPAGAGAGSTGGLGGAAAQDAVELLSDDDEDIGPSDKRAAPAQPAAGAAAAGATVQLPPPAVPVAPGAPVVSDAPSTTQAFAVAAPAAAAPHQQLPQQQQQQQQPPQQLPQQQVPQQQQLQQQQLQQHQHHQQHQLQHQQQQQPQQHQHQQHQQHLQQQQPMLSAPALPPIPPRPVVAVTPAPAAAAASRQGPGTDAEPIELD